jgi:hypothetical protein
MTTLPKVLLVAGIVIAGAVSIAPPLLTGASAPPRPFATASVHFEQNVTDGDVEVVFEVKGGADGLSGLSIVGPDGRTVLSYEAPDASTLGLRAFRVESPEPRDAAKLKAAYPEGAYMFAGWTSGGDTLSGQGTLSHALPAAPSLVRPKAEAEGVATKGLEIAWTPVPNAAAYVVKIEQEDLNEVIETRVLASATRFAVPNGFLRSGREYVLGVGSVLKNGNMSVLETTFTTASTTARK